MLKVILNRDLLGTDTILLVEKSTIFVVKNFTATFDFCGAKKQKIILELFQLLNIDLKLFIV